MADWSVKLDLGRVPNLLAALLNRKAFHRGLDKAGEYLTIKLDDYPAQKSVSRKEAYGVTFFSDIQRKAFFAKLNNGQIKVPYPRTGALGKSWYTKQETEGTVEIGNSQPYARTVMDKKRQSRMMAKIGWRVMQDIMKKERVAMLKIVAGEVLKGIRGK